MPSACTAYRDYCAMERHARGRAATSGKLLTIAQAHADEAHAQAMKRQLEPLLAEAAEDAAALLNHEEAA